MSNSLRSRPKELALSRKLGSCIKSGKEDNRVRYTQIFEKNFLEIAVPFDFHPGISGNFRLNGSPFGNSTISVFSGTFPKFNCCTICPSFENFEIFGRMVSAHVFTDTEIFLPSLPSQCFNLKQRARITLNFTSKNCSSGGNPL